MRLLMCNHSWDANCLSAGQDNSVYGNRNLLLIYKDIDDGQNSVYSLEYAAYKFQFRRIPNFRKTSTNFVMSILLSFFPSVRTEQFGFTGHIVMKFNSRLRTGKKYFAVSIKTLVDLCWVSYWILPGREET